MKLNDIHSKTVQFWSTDRQTDKMIRLFELLLFWTGGSHALRLVWLCSLWCCCLAMIHVVRVVRPTKKTWTCHLVTLMKIVEANSSCWVCFVIASVHKHYFLVSVISLVSHDEVQRCQEGQQSAEESKSCTGCNSELVRMFILWFLNWGAHLREWNQMSLCFLCCTTSLRPAETILPGFRSDDVTLRSLN